MRLPNFLSRWCTFINKGSSRNNKQQNHQSYPCPPCFNPSDTRTLREILDHTPPQDLQKEVGKYVIRKRWNVYVDNINFKIELSVYAKWRNLQMEITMTCGECHRNVLIFASTYGLKKTSWVCHTRNFLLVKRSSRQQIIMVVINGEFLLSI
ncbi:hypothetical protein RCL_jg13372.t1 [Rhizophagus clarus]|uniref:Uncharacterized protein n=1 Tax=Rhizophagus clarus TaxID=94130 RepID=A0A8H3LRX7_9GLOM|nr:hypothetical protein RCL_jg13372.t1 [Rhizophagus clarus]